jgi:F0F1-type ATP synthase membrane subunit b/b'
MEGMVGVAAPMVAGLVDLDATYFIQMGLFLVLYILLSQVFFAPYVARLRRRDQSSRGLRERAKDALHRVKQLEEDAEQRLLDARQAAVAERRRLAEDGVALREAIVQKERERMQARVDGEMADLKGQKDTFLAVADKAAEEMAGLIEHQVRSVEVR